MPTTAAPPITEQDVAAIRAIIQPWNKACVERNWDDLLTMCTEDMIFMPPGEPSVQGNTRIREWLDAFPDIKEISWDIDHVEGRGDLAYLRGWNKMVFDIDGTPAAFNGKYVDVCRRQDDGTWRFCTVMWSSDETDA